MRTTCLGRFFIVRDIIYLLFFLNQQSSLLVDTKSYLFCVGCVLTRVAAAALDRVCSESRICSSTNLGYLKSFLINSPFVGIPNFKTQRNTSTLVSSFKVTPNYIFSCAIVSSGTCGR